MKKNKFIQSVINVLEKTLKTQKEQFRGQFRHLSMLLVLCSRIAIRQNLKWDEWPVLFKNHYLNITCRRYFAENDEPLFVGRSRLCQNWFDCGNY